MISLPLTVVACTSHAPRPSAASATALLVSPTVSVVGPAQSTTPTVGPAQSTTPTVGPAQSTTPTVGPAQSTSPTTGSPAPLTSPSSTDIVGGSTWGSHILVITGHSLGGVTIGMSSAAAAHAAGVSAFTAVGDGVLVPTGPSGSSPPYLYLDSFAGQPAASFRGAFTCVGAGGSESATRSVVTALGLRLGDSAARVREIYGTAAIFIPTPTTGGIDPNPGYVVHQGQFDLVFKLDESLSRVIAMAGGIAPMTPSECNS